MSVRDSGVTTIYRVEVWRDGLCREARVFLGDPAHTSLASHRDDTGTVHMYELIEACAKAIVGDYEKKDLDPF